MTTRARRTTVRFFAIASAAVAFAAGAVPGPAVAAATFSGPTVTVATINGSGCPAGTAATSVAADGSSITAVYTAFTAQAGAGSTPTQFRRNCQLSIQVISPGETFAVTSVTEQGSVSVPAGGTALQRTNYYLAGNPAGTPVDHPASGPVFGAWDQNDPNPFSAPCGTTKNLNVNIELRVTTSGGVAASLSLNGAGPGTTISLGFTPCP